MNGNLYLSYQRMYKPKYPTLEFWGNILFWIILLSALIFNFWASPVSWLWVLYGIGILWSLLGIGFWGAVLLSKYAVEKELKKMS